MTTISELQADEICEGLQQFKRDGEYWHGHRAEFLALYPNQWVAVFEGRMVGHDADNQALLDRLDEEGVDVLQAYIEFVSVRSGFNIL